jgi:hypothetical protein
MEYKKKYFKYKNKYLRLKNNINLKGGNLLEHNIQDVGEWSGTCTCPNGQQYKVGDNHNGCRSLACIGGVSNGCSRHDRSGLRKRVTCVNTTNPTNLIEENVPEVGGWSGTCTCPNGQQYKVGDNHNGCRSLACIGGVSSGCSRNDRSGLNRRVTCAPQPPQPQPPQPPQPQPPQPPQPQPPQNQLNNGANYYNSQAIQGELYPQEELNQIINSDNNYNENQYNLNLITLNDSITNLRPDNRNLRNFEGTILPIIPVDYQRGRPTINYELSPDELQRINISYGDNPFYGLNYPNFTPVIQSLNEGRFNNLANNFNASGVIIQNVKGNGECFFRAVINGLRYSRDRINLRYSPENIEQAASSISTVNLLKNLILNYIKFCLQEVTNITNNLQCTSKLYTLIFNRFIADNRVTSIQEFENLFVQEGYNAGDLEIEIISLIFGVNIKVFDKRNPNFYMEALSTNPINENLNTLYIVNTGGHWMSILPY